MIINIGESMAIFLIVTVCVCGVYYFIGRVFADFALKRGSGADTAVKASLQQNTEMTPAQIEEENKHNEARSFSEKHLTEEIEIKSADDLKLYGYLYKNQTSDPCRYVLLMHGFQDDHKFMEPYAMAYFAKGFHVLIPDQRGHGQSEGKYTTMGWKEKDDILRWVRLILERDPKARIVLHGVSMGASSIMMAAGDGFPENVCVCVSDCGYTTLWSEYLEKMKEMFSLPPSPVLFAASLAARVRPGFWIQKVSTLDALRKNHTPMLFIHGDADDYNPYRMMDELYKADASVEKQKLTIRGARHARSVYTDPDAYWNGVWDFLKRYI